MTGLVEGVGVTVRYFRSRWMRTSLLIRASTGVSVGSVPAKIVEARVTVTVPSEFPGLTAVMRMPVSRLGVSISR